MIVRSATAEDVDGMINLAVEMVLHSVSPFRTLPADQVQSYRREDLQSLRDILGMEHSGLFVAELDGQLVGHIIVVAHQRDSSSGSPQAYIYDVSIRAGYWGRGIGRALMDRAEEFARHCGMTAIGLGVTLSNHRALHFYELLGYQKERVLMVKNL
ncbi:MAG: GNAT family N-acetyltransferase [Vulcanimicrobiota bacterium]